MGPMRICRQTTPTLIVTEVLIGEGRTLDDPCRLLTQIWSQDGRLLHSFDALKDERLDELATYVAGQAHDDNCRGYE